MAEQLGDNDEVGATPHEHRGKGMAQDVGGDVVVEPGPGGEHRPEHQAFPVAGEAEWLDVEAASSYAGLSGNTIYRLVREGRLAALRFPVRVRRSDLDRGFELAGSSRGRRSASKLGHRLSQPLRLLHDQVDGRFLLVRWVPVLHQQPLDG